MTMISRILIINKDTLNKLKKIKEIENKPVNQICREQIHKYVTKERK